MHPLVAGSSFLRGQGRLIAASTGARQSTELYDPTSGTFSNTASFNIGRTDHSALLLQNGQATAVGGYKGNGGNIECLLSAVILDRSKSPICGSSPLSAAQLTIWSEQTFAQSTPTPGGLTMKKDAPFQLFFEVTA